jgi:Protein of unknown function (DUF3618)
MATSEQTLAELEQARSSLAANIDAITDRVNPMNLTKRRLNRIKQAFIADDGTPNPRNIAIAVTLTTVLVLYVIRRRGA